MKASYLLAVLLMMGILLTTGCCGATGNVAQTNNQGQANAPTAPAKQVVADKQEAAKNIENGEIGKTYAVEYLNSKYEVTLVKAEFAKSTNTYAKGNYLMSYFEIKNTGETSDYFVPEIYAVDSTQEKYDTTIAFGMSDEYSKTLDFAKKLTPNTKMSGWAAIEVPENTKNINLYFEYTNMFLSQTPNYIKYRISAG